MKGITMQDRCLLCGYVYNFTFCQSDSHLPKLLRSSWSLFQSEELWMGIVSKVLHSSVRDVFRKVIYLTEK